MRLLWFVTFADCHLQAQHLACHLQAVLCVMFTADMLCVAIPLSVSEMSLQGLIQGLCEKAYCLDDTAACGCCTWEVGHICR